MRGEGVSMGASMNGDTGAWEGEPVPTGAEIEIKGLGWVVVGSYGVDRGFNSLNFFRGWGFGIVDQSGGIRSRLSIYRAWGLR